MPRGVIRADLKKASGTLVHTDSAKKFMKSSAEGAKPHHSQSGLTKVNLVSQHPYEGFNPPRFAAGTENRMFGVHESVVSNTMANTHPEPMRSYNLRRMVESTVGDAYDLANSGVLSNTVGMSHQDSIAKGTGGIGPVKTQPMRYGQVPFGGKKF
jgi:hypothetical protein